MWAVWVVSPWSPRFSSSIYPFSWVSSNLQPSADFLTFYESHIQKEPLGTALFCLLRDDGNLFVSCMKICHLQSLKYLTSTHFYLCSSCGALSICRGCTWLWYHRCLTHQAMCQGILWQSTGVQVLWEKHTPGESKKTNKVTNTMSLIVSFQLFCHQPDLDVPWQFFQTSPS